jgi:hypothetical protein
VAELLTSLEFRVVEDRSVTPGGPPVNLAVGPSEVIMWETASWDAQVSIKSNRLFVGRHPKDRLLARLHSQLESIEKILRYKHPGVRVTAMLLLGGATNSQRAPQRVSDVTVAGRDILRSALTDTSGQSTLADAAQVQAYLTKALHPATSPVRAQPDPSRLNLEPTSTSAAFEMAHRFYYLKEWRTQGQHRLYMKDSDGTQLGWKNVLTGNVTVEFEGDERKLIHAILSAATPVGVRLAADELVPMTTGIPEEMSLSRFANLRVRFIIGQEWRKGRTFRLYGTYIDPASAVFELGFVDLRTGESVPVANRPKPKETMTVPQILQLLGSRRPVTPSKPRVH